MPSKSKGYRESEKLLDKSSLYAPEEALELIQKTARAKFDETVEVHVRLGIDPKRSDQTVRGTVVLPNGTGKTPRVIVFTKGDKARDAESAGADLVGAEDLIEKVKGGWSGFDIAVASPDMMGQIGKELGKILGPRMPNPKAGTVTQDMDKTIKELKSGKVQYRIDKSGIIHSPMGRVSFGKDKLMQNLLTLVDAIVRAKPPAAKGTFLRTVTLATTMGPGVKVDTQKLTLMAVASTKQ
ncbi:MAG: 50S ribosomal protein L1 [bacterium]